MRSQTEKAIEEADLSLFLVDELMMHLLQPQLYVCSSGHGTALVVITGFAAANASAITMPKFSLCVGKTKMSLNA